MPNCILQIIPPFFLHNDVEPARQTAEAYRAWPILAPCFSHVCFGLFVCPCDLVFSSLLSLIDYRQPPPPKKIQYVCFQTQILLFTTVSAYFGCLELKVVIIQIYSATFFFCFVK